MHSTMLLNNLHFIYNKLYYYYNVLDCNSTLYVINLFRIQGKIEQRREVKNKMIRIILCGNTIVKILRFSENSRV